MRTFSTPLLLTLLSAAPLVQAAPVAYTDEVAYRQALSDLGLGYVHEGFEDNGVWGSYRSTVLDGFSAASEVTNLGVTWTSNAPDGGVTTSEGPALTGNWGFYSYPHGSFANPPPGVDCQEPGACIDGFIGTASTGVFYGIGGWIETNTPYLELGLFLGGYPNNPVDFGETCDGDGENCISNALLGTAHAFFGVIDTDGFTRFEFRDLEGTLGEHKFLFADDFTIAGSVTAVPVPAAVWLFGSGLVALLGIGRRK